MVKYLIFTLISCASYAQTIQEQYSLLWEISGNGLEKPSYLFGSFHLNDRRLFEFSDSTYVALNSVDAVALETDVFSLFNEWDTRQGTVDLEYDSKGNPYTSRNHSTSTVYGDEDGMPQFLDGYFQQYCFNAKKDFFPLETVDFQLNLFGEADFPTNPNIRLEALLISREDLVDLYLKGDIYAIDEMMKVNLSLSEGLYESLIVDRNFGMAKELDSLLQLDVSIFCAVGAGHLAGGSGMINLLRSKGYSMRKVVASYSEGVDLHQLEVKSKRSYTYENDTLGVLAQFPGKPLQVADVFEDEKVQLIYRDLGQGNTYSIEVYPRDDASLEELAEIYIASPQSSPATKITLTNGGEGYQGISDSYPEGLSWVRVVLGEDYFFVLKAYGGNKFMNSPRAHSFFDQVSLR